MSTLYTIKSVGLNYLNDSSPILLKATLDTTFDFGSIGTFDTPLQIPVSNAVGSISDPVMIDINGNLTFNEKGTYVIKEKFLLGRSTTAAISYIHGWKKLNGIPPSSPDSYAVIDEGGNYRNYTETTIFSANPGDVCLWEIWIDSQGVQDGELSSYNDTFSSTIIPSFFLEIKRLWGFNL